MHNISVHRSYQTRDQQTVYRDTIPEFNIRIQPTSRLRGETVTPQDEARPALDRKRRYSGGWGRSGARAAVVDAPPRKYRGTRGERDAATCTVIYEHRARTHIRARIGALFSGGAQTWPTYSGSSTAVSHALNRSGLLIIILGGLRVTI